jgi:hypothetical protein
MIYHVLNGDAATENFALTGEKVICRECLIDGETSAVDMKGFWRVRAGFIRDSFGGDEYSDRVQREFDKLRLLQPTDEVNLWFGNEVFCQVNLWFVISLLSAQNADVYRIYPDADGWNCSFHDLAGCLENRRKLTADDLRFGHELWNAFSSRDFSSLERLSAENRPAFPKLSEVVRALIEKDQTVEDLLRKITDQGETDFGRIFSRFQEQAGIYGFGDLQVKKFLARI